MSNGARLEALGVGKIWGIWLDWHFMVGILVDEALDRVA